jgi:hypothetical protein
MYWIIVNVIIIVENGKNIILNFKAGRKISGTSSVEVSIE